MRVLIVDDEHLARALMREYLAAHADVEIVGECANGFEAVKAIAELAPDLVFLDIQMPRLDGFEVVELAGTAPYYIFATAFDQFALRAFEVHALDYLLKPFSPQRLAQALAQARLRMAGLERSDAALKATVQEATARHVPLARLLIRDGARVHVVATSDVMHVEAQDDYVQITTGERRFLKQQRISELEAQLDPAVFVRIHRSWIVNVAAIRRIEPSSKDSYCAVLDADVRLPISRTGLQRVRALLE